jgi:hypothetical protein
MANFFPLANRLVAKISSGKRSVEHLAKVVESVLKYLSTRDKDAFVFGILATLTIVGLAVGAPPWHRLGAGFGFVFLYIVMRFALLSVQMRERDYELKTVPAQKAKTIIEGTATEPEKIALENMRNSDRPLAE